MRFIKEIIIPGHRFDQAIHVEELKRMVSGDDGKSGPGSHIGVIVFEFVFFKDFLVDQKVSHAAIFDFLADEILHKESSHGAFNLIISSSSSSEHHPLVRMETLSEDVFIEIASSQLSVSHEFKIFEVETFLEVDVSLMDIGETGNEWFK